MTPVSVVTSRNDTIDSLLVLAVLLGAWAAMRAAETGRLRWLLLCAVVIGLGFNIKMLEVYLVLPACGVLYLLGTHARWRKRLAHLALATLVLLGVSLSWATAVDLTPASQRPYVGSSGTNSELNLALGYNGLQRLTGTLFGHGSAARSTAASPPAGGGGFGNALFNGSPAGLFRLLGTTLGGQVSWLLILAVLGLAVAAFCVPWRRLDGRGRSLLLWGTWLLTSGAFFSVANFFHPYYTVMLAPAIAALAAIGVAVLWHEYRRGSWRGWLLPLVLLGTAAVQAYILRDYPDWSRWLTPLVVGACLVAALALTMARLRRLARVAFVAVALAVAALLAAPTTWAAYSVAHGANATIPTAGPSARTSDGAGPFGGPGGGSPAAGAPSFGGSAPAFGGNTSGAAPFGAAGSSANGNTGRVPSFSAGGLSGAGDGNGGDRVAAALLRYLEAHQDSARYLVATASSMNASSVIIATGKPVMALGGFSGSDQILTTTQLARLVANGTVHYFLIQSGGPGGGNSTLTQWVTTHGTVVPSSQYETSSTATSGFGSAATLYYVSSVAAAK